MTFLQISKGYIFGVVRLDKGNAVIVRCRSTPEIKMAACKPEVLHLSTGVTVLQRFKGYICSFGVARLGKGTADRH
jgi:hypothetical protein